MNYFLFRLRLKHSIVGYIKIYPKKKSYYSVDMYGWTTQEIEYDRKDAYSGYFDKNKRFLFEGDIIRINHLEEDFRVTYMSHIDEFKMVSVETGQEMFFPVEPLDGFKSYTFKGFDVSEYSDD